MSRSTYMGMFIGAVLTGSVWMLFTAEASSTLLPDPTTTTTTTVYVAPSTTTTVAPTTTTSSTSTSITTTLLLGNWSCPEAVTLAAQVGWPADELEHLDRVMWRESRCNPKAYSSTHDHGLTQINRFWCEAPNAWLKNEGVVDECADLFRPRVNLRAALAIWQRSGWSPWGD